jgi:hypothetical protein
VTIQVIDNMKTVNDCDVHIIKRAGVLYRSITFILSLSKNDAVMADLN